MAKEPFVDFSWDMRKRKIAVIITGTKNKVRSGIGTDNRIGRERERSVASGWGVVVVGSEPGEMLLWWWS